MANRRAQRQWHKAGQICAIALFFVTPMTAVAFDGLDLRVSGGKKDTPDALRSVTTLAQLEARDDVPASDVLAAAQGDYTRLVEALYAMGYYGPEVHILLDGREAATIPPFQVPARISNVQITVDTGPIFLFDQPRVAPVAPGTPETEGFDHDEPARATAVRNRARDVVDGWRQVGHAKADVTSQDIAARHATSTLAVDVRVDPGRKLTFGDVRVTSDSAVKEPRIRQIAGIPRGETFDPDSVQKAAERLRATGTFRSVTLTEGAAQSDDTLDIEVDVVDNKPRRIGAGVELSSNEGLLLSGFWLHRNIFGGAERFRIEGEARQLGSSGMKPDYEIGARFEKPAVYGADTLFFATASVSYEEEPDFITEKGEFGIGVSQEFSDTLTGELGFNLSRSNVTDLYLPGNPERRLDVFSMPTALTWDKRDNTLDPTEGAYVRVDAEPFTIVSGTDSGVRLMLDARGYKSFGEDDGLILAARFQLGSLSGPDAVDAPPDYLFYSGGGGTVRGQPFESLDASYGGGTRLGGRNFLGLSTEARVDLTGTLGVVAFADAGYIGPESFYDGSGDWHAGAGLGLRYDTPVGPIRFDVAGPISGDTGDGVQFYIGIGQAF